MTNFDSSQRFHRVVGRAALLGLLTMVVACSSEDDQTMVYVNAPFADHAASARAVEITVTVDGVPAFARTLDAVGNQAGAFGLPLPSGQSGTAVVIIRIRDANNCVIATGVSSPIPVLSGEPAGPITIVFGAPDIACGIDAGTSDTTGPSDGPGPADGLVGEVPAGDVLPAPIDGPSLAPDGQGPEGPSPDAIPDAHADGADVPFAPDVSGDSPLPDHPMIAEVGSEAALDSAPDATPMSVFNNCSKHTHTRLTSTGAPMTFGVYKALFTPDGKTLVTLGEDGRAKVWDVTETGLAENADKLVFSGEGMVRGTLSSDGKYLAIGESGGKVTVYDLPASLAAKGAVPKWTLPATSFTPTPGGASPRHFTSDGNHLAVVYYAASNLRDPNLLVVWDLAMEAIVRTVSYPNSELPHAVLPGDAAGSMWVASALLRSIDGGQEALVKLTDVSGAVTPVTEIVIPKEEVDLLAFSPDGKWLMIGLTNGETSLWDVSDKSKPIKPASPLFPESQAWRSGVHSVAFTSDSSHLAIGTAVGYDFVVKLSPLAGQVQKPQFIDFAAVSLAFAPDNLALVIGQHSDSGGAVLYCRP